MPGKTFQETVAVAGRLRDAGDASARTALSPWPWTKGEKIEHCRGEAIRAYKSALRELKRAERAIEPASIAVNEGERYAVESMRARVYRRLTNMTGSEKWKEAAKTAQRTAQGLLERWQQPRPMPSGVTGKEMAADRKKELENGVLRYIAARNPRYMETRVALLDRLIEAGNSEIAPQFVNAKLGSPVVSYGAEGLKINVNWLLGADGHVVEKDGEKIVIPVGSHAAREIERRAGRVREALAEVKEDFPGATGDLPVRLGATNLFHVLKYGSVSVDRYNDVLYADSSLNFDELKEQLEERMVAGTRLKWDGSRLATDGPIRKVELKKDMRKVAARAAELGPAIRSVGLPAYSEDAADQLPYCSGAALSAVSGVGILPLLSVGEVYSGTIQPDESGLDGSQQDDKLRVRKPFRPFKREQPAEKIRAGAITPKAVFVLSKDGRLVGKKIYDKKLGDSDVIGSMINAVQGFVRESLTNGEPAEEEKAAAEYAGTKLQILLKSLELPSYVGKDKLVAALQRRGVPLTDWVTMQCEPGPLGERVTKLMASSTAAARLKEMTEVDDITYGEQKLMISRMTNCDLVVAYEGGTKDWIAQFLDPAAKKMHRAVEALYGNRFVRWTGDHGTFVDMENYMDLVAEVRKLEDMEIVQQEELQRVVKKQRRRKAGAVTAFFSLVGTGVGVGVWNYVANLPHGIITEDVPATLSPTSDVELVEDQNLELPVIAGAPAGYSLLARLAFAGNDTPIAEIPLTESESGYSGLLNVPGSVFAYDKLPLNLSLWRDKNKNPADGYEKLDASLAFNLSKRHKVNLAPEIIIQKLSKVNGDYVLEVITQDKAGDEVHGTDVVEAYLNGVLLAADKGQLKTSFGLKEEGDHELEIKAYDATDHGLFSAINQVVHKNYKPTVDRIVVTPTGHDQYDVEIFHSDKDGSVSKVPVRVGLLENGTVTYAIKNEVLLPESDHVKFALDLRDKIPGIYQIEASAVDNENETSKPALATAEAVNDPITFTVHSMQKQDNVADTWSYDIDWSKPDGAVYGITVGFAAPDSPVNEVENYHPIKDNSLRSGKVTGKLDASKSYPVPAERDLTVKGVEQYGPPTKLVLGKAVTLENNAASVFSSVTSENGNGTGNNFAVKVIANDDDTSNVKLTVDAERDVKLASQSAEPNAKSFEKTLDFNLSSEEPGPLTIKGYLTDNTSLTYQIFEHNITVADDDIVFKDVALKYNRLPKALGGKKIMVKANLSNPDDEIPDDNVKLVLTSLNDSKDYEFPLPLLGSGRNRGVQNELDASALPSGNYMAKITGVGKCGKSTTYNCGLFEKNESLEIVELPQPDPDSEQPDIRWNYDTGIAEMTPVGDNVLKRKEVDENYVKYVPQNVRDDFYNKRGSLINPADPIDTASKMQPWLTGYIPDTGVLSRHNYAQNMTSLYRWLVTNMSANDLLTSEQRALWARASIIPLTRTNNWFESLISVDVNNDGKFDKTNEQKIVRQDEFRPYQSVLGANQYVTENGYGTVYDKDLAVNRLLLNRYDSIWQPIPSWYDVRKASEQELCDQTDHPAPANGSRLAQLEKSMISYENLGLPQEGKLEFEWDAGQAKWRTYMVAPAA